MTPVQIIQKLFLEHFRKNDSGNFEWIYLEGVSLGFVDPETQDEINRLLDLQNEDKPV